MTTITAAAGSTFEAALFLAVRPGPGRALAGHRTRHGRAGFRDQPENPQRRLPQTDLDDRGADRVLRGGAWHCRRRRLQEGRPRRRQGADLFRGDDHDRARGRPAARLSVRPRPRHEHQPVEPGSQGAHHLSPTTPTSCGRRHRRLPAQCRPQHLVRRAGAQRRAAGAVLRGAVRHQPGAGRRREGREDHLHHRRGFDRAVPHHGADRAHRAARRAGRGGLHRRQIWRRLAEAARLAGRAVLRLGRRSSFSASSAA